MNKLKSIIFTLATITSLTMFLTSCEKDAVQATASDQEVVSEVLELASEQVDFSSSEETEFYVTLDANDLSPSVAQAIQEGNLTLTEDITLTDATNLFCSVKENCPISDVVTVNSDTDSITHRDCVRITVISVYTNGDTTVTIIRQITICFENHE